VAKFAKTPYSGLRERKAQRTRAELINAAVDLCLRVGYENATVELISSTANVSPRTFSRYFATKDAVFLAVLDAVADAVVAEVRAQSAQVGPLEALRAAHLAVFERIAERPYGQPSADQVALMLRVINSSDTLRKKAIDYRNHRVMEILAERAGMAVADRRLELARTLFNVTVITACAGLVEDTEPALLGPGVMLERLEQAFGQLAEMAADLPTS
jgi:AcrR family transcriptional regulator